MSGGLPDGTRPTDDPLGVVTVYRAGEDVLTGPDQDARFLADAVGAALLGDVRTGTEDANPSAWADRARVHQATGMVVAQLAVTPDDALALLRAHAFADSTSLDDIARAVVDRQLDFAHHDSTGNKES